MIRRAALAAIVAVMAGAPALRAQLTECLPESADYTIFVDDFRLRDPATATPSLKTLVNSVQTALRNQLEDLSLRTEPALRPVDCTGRFPKASDFVKSPVEWMNNRKVIMELWAVVREAGEQEYDADFNIAIIPARLLEIDKNEPPGIFRIPHKLAGTGPQRDLKKLFEHHREFAAYAFVGAGLRAMREKKWPYAAAYLCRGVVELRGATPTPPNERLLTYAIKATKDVVTLAQKDPAYAGPLTLRSATTGACQP